MFILTLSFYEYLIMYKIVRSVRSDSDRNLVGSVKRYVLKIGAFTGAFYGKVVKRL